MLPAAEGVAAEIEITGVLVPVATEMGAVPLTLVTVPVVLRHCRLLIKPGRWYQLSC